MEIDQRIPDLSDQELENLHANAVRLAQSGTVRQRRQAETLLPLIGAEAEKRRASRAKAHAAQKAETQRRGVLARASLKQNLEP